LAEETKELVQAEEKNEEKPVEEIGKQEEEVIKSVEAMKKKLKRKNLLRKK